MFRKLLVAPIHYFYSGPRDLLPNTISLEGGYKIKKFDDSILEPVFNFFNESFSEREKQEVRNCRYAIYYPYSSPDENPEIPEEVMNNINRILLTLRVVKKTRAIVTMLHFRIRGRSKDAIQVIHKPITNITFPTNTPVGSQHFIHRDASKIRHYWRKVQYLYTTFGGRYHKILNALFFFELGHQNHMYKPRMVNFVTCLESLFNTSDQQISYTLRIRCAYFLERNPTMRLALSQDVKDVYSLRSAFVHGQGTPQSILNNFNRQERLLSLAEDISRRCLQKIFDKDLIQQFGDINLLNREFINLEMGVASTLR